MMFIAKSYEYEFELVREFKDERVVGVAILGEDIIVATETRVYRLRQERTDYGRGGPKSILGA